jgi:hypothetical protein
LTPKTLQKTSKLSALTQRKSVPCLVLPGKLNPKPRKFNLLLSTLYPVVLILTPTLQFLKALTQLINSSLEMRTGASVEATASLKVSMVHVEERSKETLAMAIVS